MWNHCWTSKWYHCFEKSIPAKVEGYLFDRDEEARAVEARLEALSPGIVRGG